MTQPRPADFGLPPRFHSFRSYPGFSQLDCAVNIASSEKRFPLLSAPPGSGKTLIDSTVAKLTDSRTLFLVSTKALEDQRLNDFSESGLFGIRGHRNYSCAQSSYDSTGDLVELECTAGRANCLYWADVERARQSDLVVTNYAHWVTLQRSDDPDRLGTFDFLVCDEAHALEPGGLLVDLLSIKLTKRALWNLLSLELPWLEPEGAIEPWVEWARYASEVCERQYADLRRVQKQGSQPEASRDLLRLTRLAKELSRIERIPADGVAWVAIRDAKGVTLSPVWAAKYAEEYLFRGIERVLLSSATLSPATARYLGIQSADSEFIEVPSGFDPRRRPFIYIPTTRVDHKITEGQLRILMNRVDSLIAGRFDRKGLIHSQSYRWMHEITRRSRHADIFLSHSSEHARRVIHDFKRMEPPAVLVSPVVREGHDFLDDTCRWQLIWKVPFLDGRDPLTKARSDSDKSYKDEVASQAIQQMAGRPVRSQADWSETVILDDHWAYFRNKAYFPKYFKAAWQQMSQVPPPLDFA